MAVCLCFIGKASAQWVVSDPGNLAQGIINTTKQIVQTSTTAKNTLDGFMEAQKIFQQGKKYYDALKAVHDVVKGGIKVKKSIELVAMNSPPFQPGTQSCSPKVRTCCRT